MGRQDRLEVHRRSNLGKRWRVYLSFGLMGGEYSIARPADDWVAAHTSAAVVPSANCWNSTTIGLLSGRTASTGTHTATALCPADRAGRCRRSSCSATARHPVGTLNGGCHSVLVLCAPAGSAAVGQVLMRARVGAARKASLDSIPLRERSCAPPLPGPVSQRASTSHPSSCGTACHYGVKLISSSGVFSLAAVTRQLPADFSRATTATAVC